MGSEVVKINEFREKADFLTLPSFVRCSHTSFFSEGNILMTSRGTGHLPTVCDGEGGGRGDPSRGNEVIYG